MVKRPKDEETKRLKVERVVSGQLAVGRTSFPTHFLVHEGTDFLTTHYGRVEKEVTR